MAGKHCYCKEVISTNKKKKGKHYNKIKQIEKLHNKGIKTNIIKPILIAIVMIILTVLCQYSTTYGKYVINKEIVIGVQTAEYYLTATAEKDKYITKERNRNKNKHKQL